MDIKNERKLFEQHVWECFLKFKDSGGKNPIVNALWEGWIARANVSPWECGHTHKPAPDQFVFAYISVYEEPRLVGYDDCEEKWFYAPEGDYLNSADDEYVKNWMPIPKLPAEVKK